VVGNRGSRVTFGVMISGPAPTCTSTSATAA
jgi:hypothetical protein